MATHLASHSMISAVLLAASILVSCTPDDPVSRALRARIQRRPDAALHLSDITDFEWQRVIVFGPYTTRATADAVLEFAWPGFDSFELDSSDGFSLLVFVDQGAIVHAERHPRCRPDFAPETLARPLTPVEAVFAIDWPAVTVP